MDDLTEKLRSVSLFDSLTASDLEQLIGEAHVIDLKPSDQIIEQGEMKDSVFVILSGVFEVIKLSEEGKKFLAATLRENDIFGEMSFLTGEPRSCSVISVTTSTVLEIKKSKFKKFLDERPELLLSLINLMERRVIENNAFIHPPRTE